MPTPLSTSHRNRLQAITSDARDEATSICRAALENLAVHEGDYRPHMSLDQRLLRNRLRARGKALGDARDERSGRQELKRLAEEAAYEHWHRLLFTRFLAENNLLMDDDPVNPTPQSLEDCEGLAADFGAKDGFDLACRFAAAILPGVFRRDDPILELAFPANDRKKLRNLLDSIPQDVFTASDSLGWTYQFWQTKRKAEVNVEMKSGLKVGADELAPVTQLFTEDYMVDFLLDNTLGAWWAGRVAEVSRVPFQVSSCPTEADARAACALPGQPWKYLRFVRSDELNTENLNLETQPVWKPAAGSFEGWPKRASELKCLDPCMGSGHFVVAMFERLVALRMAEEGLEEIAAVGAVLRDNLFGLELDPRCTQIAAFNLALAAWRRVGHCPLPPLHLACSGLAPNAKREDWLKLTADAPELRFQMGALYDLFQKAPVLGSLINPRADKAVTYGDAFSKLQPLLDEALKSEQNRLRESVDTSDYEMTVTAQGVAKAAEILAGQFTLVATNVPFLGRASHNEILREFCDEFFLAANKDLATVFLSRICALLSPGAVAALVVPFNWTFLPTYKVFRQWLLTQGRFHFLVSLGGGNEAFEIGPGNIVNIGMVGYDADCPRGHESFFALDATGPQNPTEKAKAILSQPLVMRDTNEQVRNPDSRITVTQLQHSSLLSKFVSTTSGLKTGDMDRFSRRFWEIENLQPNWEALQRTADSTALFSGRTDVIHWEREKGSLARLAAELKHLNHVVQNWKRGQDVWGKRGVAIGAIGNVRVSMFEGDRFDSGLAVIVPQNPSHLLPIWCYVASEDYENKLRKIDSKLAVTTATLAKVPFDLAHWQKVAAEKYPHGLPKPFSSDPTQWLFNGHPAGSDQPLHVAVARLLGYQWPRQTGSSFPDCPALGPDGLEALADTDGIVCLPPLNREQPAATRLRALLTAALSSYNERDLIQKSGLKGKGSSKTSLEDWLRDDFFSQHCALFHSRPFIWHLWDGDKDGFHALVNYHKLDHANLKKLAYTYLGDWIRDQDAAAKAETPGAAERLGAAKKLQAKLIAILEGEAPLDLFIRWKPLHQQPIGWNPDLNDGVRLNIRPFLLAGDVGAKGTGLFRAKPGIDPKPEKPDRGTEPQRPKADYPWFWCAEDPGTDPTGGKDPTGRRWNTAHFTLQRKQAAREENA